MYKTYRVMDFIQMVGEEAVNDLFSDFSCEYKTGIHNDEVENFLKRNAVEFTKKKMLITYLVMDDQDQLAGYFTLTHKPIIVQDKDLSKTSRKRLLRHAKYDPVIDAYSVSAFLIAQISKNYNLPSNERINGIKLMDISLSVIDDIQQQIGGGIIFLEAEEHQELLDFYRKQLFSPFGVRYSDDENTKYIQMIRFL